MIKIFLKIISLVILSTSLIIISCTSETSTPSTKEKVINDNFEYFLTNYRFESFNNSIELDLNKINSKNLINYYYLKMKMTYAAYTIGDLLQRYEYNKNFNMAQNRSSELDDLGSILSILLLSNVLGENDISSYIKMEKDQIIKKTNPLYYRYQVMNAVATGKIHNKILKEHPQTASRYGFNGISKSVAQLSKGRSLKALDRMIVAERKGSIGMLDSLFHFGAKTPLFFYEYRYPNNQTIKIYDVESMGLAFSYYSDKLIDMCKQKSDVSEIYKNYLLANCYFYHGNIKNTINKLQTVVDNEQSGSTELFEISKAIYKGCQKILPHDFNEQIHEFHSDLAKVKYCEAIFQFSGFAHYNKIDSIFSGILRDKYELIDSREGEYFDFSESENSCIDIEILFSIGRYFLLTNQISKSEKCFLSIYQMNKSFSLKDNLNCGNLFEYNPADFLLYSSLAMVHNNVMLPIVSQEISATSMTEKIFLIPSKLLSNLITQPDIYSDNKIE